jgi:hypothetical protein
MMTKATFSTVLAAALLCACFAGNAFANPSEVKLTFKYRITGAFAVNINFDSPITSRCIIRHRSSLYYEGDKIGNTSVLRRATLSRALIIGRKSTSLRATGLPGINQTLGGRDPIIAVQARLVCSGEDDITSNVEARFLICGAGAKRVGLSQYLSLLQKKLKKST